MDRALWFRCGSSCRNETVQPERLRVQLPPAPLRRLQTGTGTAQTTAISTAAITAVIFSLVDRSMASSGAMPISAAALYAAWGLRCDVDHAPTGSASLSGPGLALAARLIGVRRSAFSDMDARGEMDRTMVTAGYFVLLTVLVAAVGWACGSCSLSSIAKLTSDGDRAPVIAAPACRLWPAAGPSGAGLRSMPPRASLWLLRSPFLPTLAPLAQPESPASHPVSPPSLLLL
jgi:hypothetical protein